MFCRILFFILLALFLSAFMTQGTVCAQQIDKGCYKDMCGPGYKPVMQSNGICLCLPADGNGPGDSQSPSTTQGDGGKSDGSPTRGIVPQ